jgi:hypothetical protein
MHWTLVDGPLPPLSEPARSFTPQHSVVDVQRSPMMWQPDSGWQMLRPENGDGAHERLQQAAPVHVPCGEQSSPAGRHAPPVTLPALGSCWQVPT